MIVLMFLSQSQGYGDTLYWAPSNSVLNDDFEGWTTATTTPGPNWSTSAPDSNGITTSNSQWVNGSDAVFGSQTQGFGPFQVDVNSAVTVHNINFDAPGTTISSGKQGFDITGRSVPRGDRKQRLGSRPPEWPWPEMALCRAQPS